jgi:hypothetical protein
MAQPHPQILEHIIRDTNPKWFHYDNSSLGRLQWPVERASKDQVNPVTAQIKSCIRITHANVLYHALAVADIRYTINRYSSAENVFGQAGRGKMKEGPED